MEPMGDFTAHLTTGAVVVYAIEALKKVGWCPWIHADSGTASRIVSAICAAAIAFGIQATGDAGVGWTITIPPLSVLLTGLYHWVEQFTTQQLVFDGIVQKSGKGTTT